MGRSYHQFAEEAKSKSQQRLMGMVRAAQKGEMDNPSEQVKKLAMTMKKKDVKDFASTKHENLPTKKVSEEVVNEVAPVIAAGARMVGRHLLAKAVADRVKKKAKEREEREEKEETKINEIAPAIAIGGALGLAAGGGVLVKKAVDAGKALKRNAEKRMGKQPVKESAWQRKEGKNKTGGLNEKGRKSYERENPGSDLKAPQPEGGPRKRSFCARMGGVKGPMKKPNGEPTRKALALRKWKC